MTTIGDRVREARKELGVTLEEVANKVGVSRQTLSRYENSIITNIPSDKVELLAIALKTTPAYLMGWSSKFNQSDDAGNFQALPVIKDSRDINQPKNRLSKKEQKLIESYNILKDSDDPKDRAAAAAIDQLLGLDEQEDGDR